MKNHSKWQRDDSYSFQSVLRRTVKCEGLYIFSGRMNRGHAASEGCLNHLTRLNKSPSIWRKNARSPRSPESLSFSRHAVTHLSGFLSYLIGWRVSLSGLAYNSPYCWLWLSSLGLSLENSKEECSTSLQARSKILTRSVYCSQSLRFLEDDYNQLSGFRQATPPKSQALTHLLTPTVRWACSLRRPTVMSNSGCRG